jgi:hypothetical protein
MTEHSTETGKRAMLPFPSAGITRIRSVAYVLSRQTDWDTANSKRNLRKI